MFSLLAWTSCGRNSRVAGDMRHHDLTVMILFTLLCYVLVNFRETSLALDNNSWYLPSARGSLDPLTMQTDPATPCGDAWRTQDPPVRCCSVEGPCAPDIVFSKLPSDKLPYTWSRDDVASFLKWCQEEFDLDDLPKEAFKLNGKALCILTKSDICQRTPEAGDVIYNMLQRLLAKEKQATAPCNDAREGSQPVVAPPAAHIPTSNPGVMYCQVLGREVNVDPKVNFHSIPGPLNLKVSRAGKRRRKNETSSAAPPCPCDEKSGVPGKPACRDVPVLPPGFVCPGDCDGKNCDKLIEEYKRKMATEAALSKESLKEPLNIPQQVMAGTQSYFVYPASYSVTSSSYSTTGVPIPSYDLNKVVASSKDDREKAMERQGEIKHLMSLQKSISYSGADIYKTTMEPSEKKCCGDNSPGACDKQRDSPMNVPLTVDESSPADAKKEGLPAMIARQQDILPDVPSSVRAFSPLTLPRSPLTQPRSPFPQPNSPATTLPRSPFMIPGSPLSLPRSPLTIGLPKLHTEHTASPLLIPGRYVSNENTFHADNEHRSPVRNQSPHPTSDVEPKLRHYISEKASHVNTSQTNPMHTSPQKPDTYMPVSLPTPPPSVTSTQTSGTSESTPPVSQQHGKTLPMNVPYTLTRSILPLNLPEAKPSGVSSSDPVELYPRKKLMIDEDAVDTDEDMPSPMNIFMDGRPPGVLPPSSPVDRSLSRDQSSTVDQSTSPRDQYADLIAKHEVAEVMSKMSGLHQQHHEMLREEADGKLLWEFLCKLLEEPEHYAPVICWENKTQRVFRIINTENLAKLWGAQKQKTDMTYEKLSRSLRYYYRVKIISKVPGRRLTYRFEQNPGDIVKGVRGAKPGVPHRPRGSRQKTKELKRLAKEQRLAQAQTPNDPGHQISGDSHTEQDMVALAHGPTEVSRDGKKEPRLPPVLIKLEVSQEHRNLGQRQISEQAMDTEERSSPNVPQSVTRTGTDNVPTVALVVAPHGGTDSSRDSLPMVPDSSTSPVSLEQREGHSRPEVSDIGPLPVGKEPMEIAKSVIVPNKAIGLAVGDKDMVSHE